MKTVLLEQKCLDKVKPQGWSVSWYNAGVDIVGKYISGLLLVKPMPDGSKRVVFTNEAGVKFLDFGFETDYSFKVYSIIPQLNKKAVVNLLRDDFALLLGIPFESAIWQSATLQNENYLGVTHQGLNYYLVTDSNCENLKRLELGSDRVKKVTINLYGSNSQVPDSISLQHHTFAMRMSLKKLEK